MAKSVERMKFNTRLSSLFRWVLWIILIFVFLRGVASFFVHPKSVVAPVQTKVDLQPALNQAPIDAGEGFLDAWYHISPNENANTRMNSLSTYVTPSFQNNLSANNDVTSSVPLHVKNILVYTVNWLNQRNVQVTYYVQLSNGTTIYPVLPLVKSGTGWFVNAIPALAPSPMAGSFSQSASTYNIPKNSQLNYLTPAQQLQIQATLQNFFNVYLQGNGDLVRRLTKGAQIQVGAVLPSGAVLSHLTFQPISTTPLEVIADVQVSLNHTQMTLEYIVSLQEIQNELYVSNLQFN